MEKIGSIEVCTHPNFTKHGKMSPTQFLHFLINPERKFLSTENFNCAFFEKRPSKRAGARAMVPETSEHV